MMLFCSIVCVYIYIYIKNNLVTRRVAPHGHLPFRNLFSASDAAAEIICKLLCATVHFCSGIRTVACTV
jgi:hypothetical protein